MLYGGQLYRRLGVERGLAFYVVGTVMGAACDGLAQRTLFEVERLVPDFVVVGEPTGLAVHRGHRGRAAIRITTKGKSCHAAAPHLGDNSIYRSMPIVQRIEALDKKLRKDPTLGKGSITITKIECETPSLSTVPGTCSIYLDRRLTAGDTKRATLDEIRRAVRGTKAKVEVLRYDTPSYKGVLVPGEKYYPSWVLDESHLLVQSAVDAYRELFNKIPSIGCSALSGSGAYTMGVAKVPTIAFGPSEEQFAHSALDNVPIEHLRKAMMFYAGLPKHVLTRLGRRKAAPSHAVARVFS
jgi:putative selenium metabolism hydrolase